MAQPAYTSEFVIEVQGLDTLTEHFAAISQLVGPITYEVVDFYGDNIVENARRIVPIDTGATLESIHKNDGMGAFDGKPIIMGDAWTVEVGPTTYYARWVEFGTRINRVPQPFMIPAIDLVEPAFVATMFDIAMLADKWKEPRGGAMSDQNVRSLISQLRGLLYTSSKAMGDVNALVGRNLFGGSRSIILGSARALGDVHAVMLQTVSTRVSRRLSGRVTGHLAGYGSASLSASATYSAFPGGAGGHRIYNRIAGRTLSTGAGNSSLLSFGRLGL